MHHPLFLFALPLATLASFSYLTVATAQITPDNSLGAENSVVTPNVQINGTPSDRIDGGAIRGDNLFHSFQEFNINAGRGAYFSNPQGIANILTRVTGGNASNIQGVLGVLGTANLFLINPKGIIFGPNARLDVGGSFLGSTANSLIFKNGFEFSATNPQAPPLLTINVPIGLRYGDNPREIQVQGPGSGITPEAKEGSRDKIINLPVTGLQVEPGKTLALVGGKVSVEGGVLQSQGGRIEIGSFDSNQIVNLVPAEQGFSLAYQGTPNFRDIEFSNKSSVNVTGDGGGSIAIQGRNINFSESLLLSDTLRDKNGGEIRIVGDSISFNQSSALANTFGSGNGAQITLDATNKIKFENGGGVSIQTWDKGKAGDINIGANSLDIGGGSSFVSWAIPESTGNSGNINMSVKGPLVINTAGIVADSDGTGNAGKININANSLLIDTSRVTSKVIDAAQAGEINFNVTDSFASKRSTISTDTSGRGAAGRINISAGSFRFEDGEVFSQAQENSTGKGGEIKIAVTGSLELPQSASISTTTKGKGDAGNIDIRANNFRVERSNVVSNSEGNSTGNAGKINISANSFRLENAGVSSEAAENSTGNAGEINITAGTLELLNLSGISTTTKGKGDAGKIDINANSLRVERSEISSRTEKNGTGNGGEIKITVADLFDLNTAGVRTENLGNGNGGNIEINTNNLYLRNGSQVSASTSGKGNAGSVTVNATGNVSADGNFTENTENKSGFYSTVESLGVGNAGGVEIRARSLSLTNGGTISTSNLGSGAAGEITVTTTKDIQLDNQGSIRAETRGGKGNISLNPRDLILRNNSSITTNAQGTANGGKIEINNTGNLVVFEDSKITANAEEGSGGTVNITARGIFRSPNNITATSNAGPQFNGVVQLNTLEVDPSQGLFELTEAVIDPAQQVAQNPCIKGFGSTFTIVGRGGFPTDPNKILSSDNVRVDLIQPVPSKVSSTSTPEPEKQPSQKPPVKKIIPARGWIYNEKGQVVLVGYDPTKTGPQREQPAPTSNCAAVK
ncbi:MAG: S-layer family protein [Brasilonema octagenarum HA4186-MV1]|nr:S-layer family protein [Brasilonema octagenarum HA4186-MV1]